MHPKVFVNHGESFEFRYAVKQKRGDDRLAKSTCSLSLAGDCLVQPVPYPNSCFSVTGHTVKGKNQRTIVETAKHLGKSFSVLGGAEDGHL